MSDHMTRVFRQFCADSGFKFRQIGPGLFRAQVGGTHASWTVHFSFTDARIAFLSSLPFTVPTNKQNDALQFLNLVNWHIAVGNLEMDPADGELVFRTSVACAETAITPDMVGTMLMFNLFTCDRFLPALAQVIFANADPEKAFADAIPESRSHACADDSEEEPEDEEDMSALDGLLDDIDLDFLTGSSDD